MADTIDAKLWLGKEMEHPEDEVTMFVDGASSSEIRDALNEHPEVNRLYFGHDFTTSVVYEFENRVNIVLEVREYKDVPPAMRGFVEVVLRVPSWVSEVKQRHGKNIKVADMDDDVYLSEWNGKKAYDKDNVIL